MSTKKGIYSIFNTTDWTQLIKRVGIVVNVENSLQTATISREGRTYKTGR